MLDTELDMGGAPYKKPAHQHWNVHARQHVVSRMRLGACFETATETFWFSEDSVTMDEAASRPAPQPQEQARLGVQAATHARQQQPPQQRRQRHKVSAAAPHPAANQPWVHDRR